jgi:hypothetical protein
VRLSITSVGIAISVLVACQNRGPSQAPPLDPPVAEPGGSGGGACEEPDVGGASVVLFSSDGTCRAGDALVLYRCSPSAFPVLRSASRKGAVEFLGGPFAVRVERLPANVRFVGKGDGVDVLVADPTAPTPASQSSPPPPDASTAGAGTGVVAQPLVYVRREGVTERWLRLPRRRALDDQPTAWLIGDSILDGGRKEVGAALADWDLTLDAEVGRPSSEGLALAETAVDGGADVVLVELGTNDSFPIEFRSDLIQILDSLREVPLVLWQTTRGPEDVPSIPAVNQAIREVTPTYPNVAIADWESFVPAEAVQVDGIHPDPGFESLESELLLPMLSGWRDAVSGEGATSCGREVVRATS